MDALIRVGLACVAMTLATSAWATEMRKLYFNQKGQITQAMSAVVYVRHYEVEGSMAEVQDFYYPSLNKYSDTYRVPVAQIRQFVPVLQNGTLTLWHFNGNKKMMGSYKNGKPDGLWVNWYANGNKSAVMPYVNGQSNGMGARYYRNGNKESEIQFKHNKANGIWRQWYANGSLKAEMMMVNDVVTSMEMWNPEGRLLSELSFDERGQRSGIVLDWYDGGAKKSESVYQDNELIKRTLWDEDGEVLNSSD